MHFWQAYQKGTCPWEHCIVSGIHNVCLSYYWDVNFNHLVKVISAWFLHYKLIFPFAFDKCLGRHTLQLWSLILWLNLAACGVTTLNISGCACESVSRWEYHLDWWLSEAVFLSQCGWTSPDLLRSWIEHKAEDNAIHFFLSTDWTGASYLIFSCPLTGI